MNPEQLDNTRSSYDRVAEAYVRHIYHELAGKPRDREILDAFAARLYGRGVVCDMGCGPGQVARYLADRGLDMVGVDLSPGMLQQAMTLNPDIRFYAGDMMRLDALDGSWAGIVSFYAIIHIPRDKVVIALRELRRVLQPDGLLLLAFHLGNSQFHEIELWGEAIALDYWFFDSAEMTVYLEQAGFKVEEVTERAPYAPEVEYQSRRAYILARRV